MGRRKRHTVHDVWSPRGPQARQQGARWVRCGRQMKRRNVFASQLEAPADRSIVTTDQLGYPGCRSVQFRPRTVSMSTSTRCGRLDLRRAGRPSTFGDFMAARRFPTAPPSASTTATFEDLGVPAAWSRHSPDAASPPPSPSRRRRCPTRWPGATCSDAAAPARARRYAFALPVLARLAASRSRRAGPAARAH